MTPELHIDRLLREFNADTEPKYMNGQVNHGGCMWRKAALPHAIEEVQDLVVYLYTLRDQHQEVCKLLSHALGSHDWGSVAQALNVLTVGNPEGEWEEERERVPSLSL